MSDLVFTLFLGVSNCVTQYSVFNLNDPQHQGNYLGSRVQRIVRFTFINSKDALPQSCFLKIASLLDERIVSFINPKNDALPQSFFFFFENCIIR